MLGARSSAETAVGSRPKLNTVSTRTVNTTADTIAVRVRNSSTRSLRATAHACPSSSRMGHDPPVRLRDLCRTAPTARREVHEATAPLKRHVGGELDALVHIVGRHHQCAPGATQLA